MPYRESAKEVQRFIAIPLSNYLAGLLADGREFMFKTRRTISINRPPQDVFDYLSEPANDANWQGGTESSRWTSDAPYGVGSTQVTVTRFLGRKLDLNMEITHWDPAKTFGFEVREGPVPMHGVAALEPTADGGTEVIAEGELGGFFKMAEGLVGNQLEKQVDTDFSALKLLLEADRG